MSKANRVIPPAASVRLLDPLAAFESLRAELDALPDARLQPINIDITAAVSTAMGALPRLRALRASLATLPHFNVATFDKLEAYAQAAAHSHSAHLRNDPQVEVTRLGEQAQQARERLLFDATALARRGLLDAKALEALKGPSGYRNVLFDLAALSNLLRDAWPRIEGKTAVDFSELAAARTLSADLNTALGLREQEQGEQTESAMIRKRAFTLFVQAYDEVRRAVSYLRWHEGDANEVAPSLYERRSKRNAEGGLPESGTPAAASSEAATVNPAGASSLSSSPQAARNAVTHDALPGLPGGDAFEK